MEPSTIWWVLAGITVAAELLIGSFYLLMLSLGMAARLRHSCESLQQSAARRYCCGAA